MPQENSIYQLSNANSCEEPYPASNMDTKDPSDLGEADLTYMERLTQGGTRLKALMSENQRFKAEIARLEAENQALKMCVQTFDDRIGSMQSEDISLKGKFDAWKKNDENDQMQVARMNELGKPACDVDGERPSTIDGNASLQIDSQIIASRTAQTSKKPMTIDTPAITPEQPVGDDQHHHAVLPMSVSEFDEVWGLVKHSLQNIIVDIPHIPTDRHDLFRMKAELDLPESDESLEWEVGYFRIF